MYNNTIARFSKSKLFLIILIAVILLVTLLVSANYAGADSEYKLNDSGQKYGDINVEGELEANPELIGAIATNGEIGYIYYDELHEAMGYDQIQGLSDEELEKMVVSYNDRLAQEFSSVATEFYGAEVVSKADATKVIEIADTEGIEKSSETLQEDVRKSISSNESLKKQSLSNSEKFAVQESDFVTIYETAKNRVGIEIPVYKEDGITQIGVYVVDSFYNY